MHMMRVALVVLVALGMLVDQGVGAPRFGFSSGRWGGLRGRIRSHIPGSSSRASSGNWRGLLGGLGGGAISGAVIGSLASRQSGTDTDKTIAAEDKRFEQAQRQIEAQRAADAAYKAAMAGF